MKVECSFCNAPINLDYRSAGKTVRCADCGLSFIAPTDLAIMGQRHLLTRFSVASLTLLNYLTAGVFSIVHLNMMHERMPRLRRDDPSATVAIGLCFVPVFNLYWFAFSFHRLSVRINEQRRFSGLRETAPEWLAIPVGVLYACGLLASFFTTGGLYLWGSVGALALPVYAALVQHSINDLCSHESPAVAPAI